MSRYRWGGFIAVTALGLGGALAGAPVAAAADTASWNGEYEITFFTNKKTGTSLAADQKEGSYVKDFVFSSSCAEECTATVVDGPPPTNPTVPLPITYTWNGSAWEMLNAWHWNCLRPDGSIEWNPATTRVTYRPQADGSLRGAWHTNIHSGVCEGTVYIDTLAEPA